MELGLLQGRHGEAASLVIKMLTRRFRLLEQATREKIEALSLEHLEQLAVDLLDFNDVADFEKWLASRITTGN